MSLENQKLIPKRTFTIELCPPVDRTKIDSYFQSFKHLLEYTNSFSISSHPTSDRLISGFYRSYNLARYLLERAQDVDILFHITCNDLNKVNIHARLSLLKSLNIKRILVVTGEGYNIADDCKHPELFYRNSSELLAYIKSNHRQWFELVAIAGYPTPEPNDRPSIESECDRLFEKLTNGTAGAIYTQCIFSLDNLDCFFKIMRRLAPNIKIVPSIALFNSMKSLNKSSELTKVKANDQLLSDLRAYEAGKSELFCLRYLERICRQLNDAMSDWGVTEINVCSFGLFSFASDLIRLLETDNMKLE